MTVQDKRAEPFVLFQLVGATYGIRSSQVKQVEMIENVTPVPESPDYLEGVVLLRGQAIPAVNLRVRFGFQRIPHDIRTRLIVVEQENRTVGLIVDSAREFVILSEDEINPPPEEISGLTGNYLEGVITRDGRLILILNVEAVLAWGQVEDLRTATEEVSRQEMQD